MKTFLRFLVVSVSCALSAAADTPVAYRIEFLSDLRSFSREQVAILEKLNRADVNYLGRLGLLIVPDTWVADELDYAPLPRVIEWATAYDKFILVHVPSQVFGAYEGGQLVRWGPVSSGRAAHPTPSGLFFLNWRARRRTSTDNAEWDLEWYFNFHNFRGLAFHEYALPGRPASHACLRLLRRDAVWIFEWGEGWMLSDDRHSVVSFGTPVLIIGSYDFSAPKPWTDPAWWLSPILIPTVDPTSLTSVNTSNRVD